MRLPCTPPWMYQVEIGGKVATTVALGSVEQARVECEIHWDFTMGPITIQVSAVVQHASLSCTIGTVKYNGTQKLLEFGDLVLCVTCSRVLVLRNRSPEAPSPEPGSDQSLAVVPSSAAPLPDKVLG